MESPLAIDYRNPGSRKITLPEAARAISRCPSWKYSQSCSGPGTSLALVRSV